MSSQGPWQSEPGLVGEACNWLTNDYVCTILTANNRRQTDAKESRPLPVGGPASHVSKHPMLAYLPVWGRSSRRERMREEKVHFYSGGQKLVGVLYMPDEAKERTPGIVLCQGYTGTKELFLPLLAQAFCGAGYPCLIFDYRGWGESEGRSGRLFPREQCDDIRNAMAFLGTHKMVDPERLGLYGTSFGGANVVAVAAMDERVKCVVASLAIGDGRRWLRSLRRLWEWREFRYKPGRLVTE